MFPIRMEKRACTDNAKIDRFLRQAETGFLGLALDNAPYVVPLNYVWLKGTVYFHGASEGRKMGMLAENAEVCFTVCESFGTITSPVPAHTDTAYMSVMLFGSAELVRDLAEAAEAMQAMLDKYVPGFYDSPLSRQHLDRYRSSLGSKTAVVKLTPRAITAKENAVQEGRMFGERADRRHHEGGLMAGNG